MTRERKTMEEIRANHIARAEYARTVNPYQRPTSGVHSGINGTRFEDRVKLAFGLEKWIGTAKGKYDFRKKIDGNFCKFEVKSGAGEIATLKKPIPAEAVKNGDITIDLTAEYIDHSILNSDYIIYTPYPLQDTDILAYNAPVAVFKSATFANLLKYGGFLRWKTSTALNRQGGKGFYDKITIQTFSNSIKKENAIYELVASGTPLWDFVYNIGEDSFLYYADCIQQGIKYERKPELFVK